MTWEGVDYAMRGEDFGEIHFGDYGFPNWYEVVLMGNTEWMAENADLAGGFVRATKRGFDDAIADPEGTADVLVEQNPDSLGESQELARASSTLLAESYMLDADGNFGTQTTSSGQTSRVSSTRPVVFTTRTEMPSRRSRITTSSSPTTTSSRRSPL